MCNILPNIIKFSKILLLFLQYRNIAIYLMLVISIIIIIIIIIQLYT